MGTTNTLDLNNRVSALKKAVTENAEDTHDIEKDIYAVMGQMGAKNLIPVPYYEDTEEDRGITWTNHADGTITITGTATADSAHNLSQRNNSGKLYLPNGKYILNGCPSGGSNSTFYLEALCTKDSSSKRLGIDSGAGVEITVNGDDYGEYGAFIMVRGIVKNGYAVTNPITFKPMLRLASDTDDNYRPYARTNKELTDAVNELEESAGGGGVTTQHLTGLRTDTNGCIFLDLAVDSYILVGATTKDFSASYGPFFTIGIWNDANTYKYMLRLTDMTGAAKASSNYWIDIHYMEREV